VRRVTFFLLAAAASLVAMHHSPPVDWPQPTTNPPTPAPTVKRAIPLIRWPIAYARKRPAYVPVYVEGGR
jgi:hypothetical protein